MRVEWDPQGLWEMTLHAQGKNHLDFFLCTPLPVLNNANSRMAMKINVKKGLTKACKGIFVIFLKTYILNLDIAVFSSISLQAESVMKVQKQLNILLV